MRNIRSCPSLDWTCADSLKDTSGLMFCGVGPDRCAYFLQGRMILPLYSESVKFFHHEEAMVRIAVRTITLNVYSGETLL